MSSALLILSVMSSVLQTPAAQAPATPLSLSLRGDSLGPIGSTTPFEAAVFQRLFPTATVTDSIGMTEGETYPVYSIAVDGVPVVDIRSLGGSSIGLSFGLSIHSVEIHEAPSTGALGALLGTRYDEVFDNAPEAACTAGVEEQSGRAICRAPFSDHITLVLAGSWDGPDGFLPPGEVVASWIVERVLWRP